MNQQHLLATISDLTHCPTTTKVMEVLDALSYVLADQGYDQEALILEDFSRRRGADLNEHRETNEKGVGGMGQPGFGYYIP